MSVDVEKVFLAQMSVAPSVAGVDATCANGDAGLGSGWVLLVECDDTLNVAKAPRHRQGNDEPPFAHGELDPRSSGVDVPRGAAYQPVTGGRMGMFGGGQSLGDAHGVPPFGRHCVHRSTR